MTNKVKKGTGMTEGDAQAAAAEQTKNSVLSGAKLRAKRELVGLTVEELANECGCDWRDVRSLEEPWRGVGC